MTSWRKDVKCTHCEAKESFVKRASRSKKADPSPLRVSGAFLCVFCTPVVSAGAPDGFAEAAEFDFAPQPFLGIAAYRNDSKIPHVMSLHRGRIAFALKCGDKRLLVFEFVLDVRTGVHLRYPRSEGFLAYFSAVS